MARFEVALASEKLLPPELLSKVFLLSLPDTGACARHEVDRTNPPWTFLRVCSRWREVALSQHCIWQRLTVEMSNGESVKSLLHHLWARSPTSSVSLDLRGLNDYGHINAILSEYSSRLQFLSVDIPYPALAGVLRSSPIIFERLESLRFKCIPNYHDSQALQSHPLGQFANAPNLRRIHIVSRETRLSADKNLKFPWSQLLDLQFIEVAFPTKTIPSILSHCVNLTNLTVALGVYENFDAVMPLNPPPSITLPDLHELTIILDRFGHLDRFFHQLTVPALKSIKISHWGRVEKHHTSRYHFPLREFTELLQRSGAILEVFSLTCPIFNVDVKVLLDVIPLLTSLCLGKAHPITPKVFKRMKKGFFPHLAQLTCFTTSPHAFLSLLESQCGHVSGTLTGLSSGCVTCSKTNGVCERFQALERRLLDNGKSIKLVAK